MQAEQWRMAAPTAMRVGGVALAVVVSAVVVLVVVGTRANPGLMISSLVPALVGYAAAWVLWRACIVVETSPDGVDLAFAPIWRRFIPPGDIAVVEPLADVSPLSFGGVGYRRMPGRTTALLWHGGGGSDHDDGRRVLRRRGA